ncbi:MAG: hypothetical protein AB1898_28690 [Acidobacteriota bacterium]
MIRTDANVSGSDHYLMVRQIQYQFADVWRDLPLTDRPQIACKRFGSLD